MAAALVPLRRPGPAATIRDLCTEPRAGPAKAAVATDRWLRILGEGGVEPLAEELDR